MHTKEFLLASTVSLLCLIAGCPKGTSQSAGSGFRFENEKGDPIAQVGDVTFTVEGIAEKIKQQPTFLAQRYANDPKQQEQFLDNQIRQELLSQEALRRGYLNSPEVQTGLRRLLVQKLTQTEFENLKNELQVPEQELKAYYEANPDEFHRPEKVKASFIKIPFGDNKKMASKLSKTAYTKATAKHKEGKPRQTFTDVMNEYNPKEDKNTPAGEKIGDVPYASNEEIQTKFGAKVAQALSAAKEDSATPVIEGADAFYIFYKEQLRPGLDKDFEAAKATIERKLTGKKRSEAFTKLVDDLKKKIGVTIYQEKLSKISALTNIPVEQKPGPKPNM